MLPLGVTPTPGGTVSMGHNNPTGLGSAASSQQIIIPGGAAATAPGGNNEIKIEAPMSYSSSFGQQGAAGMGGGSSSGGSTPSYSYSDSNPELSGFTLSDFLVQLEDYAPTVMKIISFFN
jgi:hypothetical protein